MFSLRASQSISLKVVVVAVLVLLVLLVVVSVVILCKNVSLRINTVSISTLVDGTLKPYFSIEGTKSY